MYYLLTSVICFLLPLNVFANGCDSSISLNVDTIIHDTNEYVNTGYGKIDKRTYTGNITKIETKTLETPTDKNLAESLQGSVAGLDINVDDGIDPEIQARIRGLSSIHASTSPLWIVDGIKMQHIHSVSDLEMIVNIRDIESIEVLKDARSCSMYGSRGANGVILITTK